MARYKPIDISPRFLAVLFAYSQGIVSNLTDDIARLFTQILYLCDRQGLTVREMFAIDCVKLPSSASKQKSGTRADFEHQVAKLEVAARVMLERHREADLQPVEAGLRQKKAQRITRLQGDAAQLRQWLTAHPEDSKGCKDTIRKSNRTDHESAKMATPECADQDLRCR